jgi:diguanylate cyclase (GGDEF)-like protein
MKAQPSDAGSPVAPVPLRLLLVEDEPIQRRVLERRLAKAGYLVDTAKDGQEAFARILREHYQILITDWDMPGMDGATLCRRVRQAELPGYLYILLLTGHEDVCDIVAGLEAGADDYLKKPANEAELLARLKPGARILELERSLREAHAQVRMLSMTDALVGTFNRRYLVDQLAIEIERSKRHNRPLAVVMADIDHFKSVNDTHGHLVGDEILQQFAERVRSSIRQSDWLARYGGEEFVIVLPDTRLSEASTVAEKIRTRIASTPMPTSVAELHVTASFGVAAQAADGGFESETVLTLLNRADSNLYRSKISGRNRVTADGGTELG